MFAFITKEEYWRWLDAKLANRKQATLKGIQDGFAREMLREAQGWKIAEVGGGESRVLEKLAQNNECWNLDKFEGVGVGPTEAPELKNVKIVPVYLGEFSPELPEGYFDAVFSISVLEHVATAKMNDCFRDMARLLKPGGLCFHAIDVYLTLEAEARVAQVLESYLAAAAQPECRLELLEPARAKPPVVFDLSYATNPDINLWMWNRAVPKLRELRARAQSCSLKAAWRKRG